MQCENCIHKMPCGNYQKVFMMNLKNLKVTDCPYYKEKDKVIELPCKVGDTVWVIRELQDGRNTKEISDGQKIKQISKNSHGIFLVVDYCHTLNIKDIGKTVFLTKEEAEKALKE